MRRLTLLVFLFLVGCAAGTSTSYVSQEERLPAPYESSQSCKGCHADIYKQFEQSEHFNAFSDPLFNAYYFKRVVPRALSDRSYVAEAKKCIYCHAPVLYMNYTGLVSSPSQAAKFETGVTCDFCHTLTGYAPNGDFVVNPTMKKQGPRRASNWHSEYSGFLEMGEFCSTCHNESNHSGSSLKSTFSEWQQSKFGEQKIACQECHMNKRGYLMNGKAEHESGTATHMNIGMGGLEKYDAPVYEKLYSHAFPGAHSNSQLAGALPLEISSQARTPDGLSIAVRIDNSRTGHMMPSGSSDLRLLWVTVTAETADGKKLTVKLRHRSQEKDYSVAGATPEDAAILGKDIPRGERVYRTVSQDAAGRQVLLHVGASTTVFDNRLAPGEVRKENYFVVVPPHYSGTVNITAKLQYLNAPTSLTRALRVPDYSAVVVSEQKTTIPVKVAKQAITQ